ncbi:hypothetical protein CspeluHIS016_0112780 [Cutaneotrichosporon spelunceum]|uniref:GATA-type domain-containing protein n=1 Tax=Cutaneotrichosporon spelunceum TaxID=1672016 RepID=A0AAD3TQ06_9TREE|nr:hypothetical protein CspeluHIS016_0112780 [Cutaneotrichosporon spelunceum]
MAGRAPPAPPFVELPSLPRPQVVDEAGFELSDEQVEALAARVAGEGKEVEDEVVQADTEASVQVSVEDGEAPEERQPLLSLDQSLVLQYSILQARHHHMRHLLPLIFTHPPVPAHNRPRLRPSGKKEFVFPTPAPPPQPLPSAEYHGPSTKEKKKKGKDTESATDADKDKGNAKSGDESEEPKKGRKKEQLAPAHEIECIARVTLQVGPLSFPNTELWVGRFVPPRQGSAGTVRGRLKSMAEPRKPKEPKPKESKEKVRKERALPRMSIDGGPAKRPRVEKPKAQIPTLPRTTPGPPPPNPDAPPRFASRQDIPQALIQRVNAAATRHPWLSVLIHKAARSVASKDELAKLGRVVARLGRGEDVGEGPEMPGISVRPPNTGAVPSRPPSGAPVRPPNAVVGPSRPPAAAGAHPPAVGIRPPNAVAGPGVRPGAPPARPPAAATRPPAPGTAVRPTAPAMPPPAPSTQQLQAIPLTAGVRPPPAPASSTSTPVAVPTPATSASAPAAAAAAAASTTPGPPAPLPPTAAPSPAPAQAPPALATVKPDESDSDVDMSGPPQVGGGWGDEPDSDSDWDADIDMRGRPQVGGGEGEEPKGDQDTPISNPEAPQADKPSGVPAAPAATATGLAARAAPIAAVAITPAASPNNALLVAPSAKSTPTPAAAHQPPAAPAMASQTTAPTANPTSAGSNVRWFPISGPSNLSTSSPQRGPARPPTARPSHLYTVPPYRVEGPQPPPFLLVAFKGQETDKFLLPLGQHSYLSRVGGDYVTSPAPTPAPTASPPVDPATGPVATHADSAAPADVASASASTSVPVTPAEPEHPLVEEVPRRNKRTRASMVKPAPKAPAKPSSTKVEEKEKEPTSPPKGPLTDVPPMPGQHPGPGTVLLSTYIPIEPYTAPDWPKLAERLPFHNPSFVEKMKAAPIKVKPEPTSPKRALRRVREEKHPRDYVLNVAAEDWLPEGPLEPITIRLVGVDDRTWARMTAIVGQVEKTELDGLVRAEPGLAPEVVQATAEIEAARAAAKAEPFPSHPPPRVRETWLSRKKSHFTSLLSRVGARRFPRFRIETTISTLVDYTSDKWAPRPYHLTTRPLYVRDAESDDEAPVAPRRIELSPSPDLEGHTKKRRKEVSAVTFEMPVSLDALDERVEAGAAKGLSKRGRAKGAAVVRKFPRGTTGAACEGCAKRGLKVWRRGPNGRGTLCNDCGDKFSAGTLGELKAPGAASRRDSTPGTPGTPGTPATSGEKVKAERGEGTVDEGEKEAPDGEKEKDGEAGGDGSANDKAGGGKDTQPEKSMGDEASQAEAPKESTDSTAVDADAATESPVVHDELKATAVTASSPDPLSNTVEDVQALAEPLADGPAPPTDAMDVDP